MTPHVLIAGGGIGGLTLALAFLRRGFDVDVFEQAPELREVGAGVQLSPNGTRALSLLGVLEPLLAVSCNAEGKEVRHWQSGDTWKLFDLGAEAVERYGFPYLTVYRPDLLAVLAEAVQQAKPGAVRLGARCAGFAQRPDAVILHLDDGSDIEGDALIGADGVHSQIRRCLFGDDDAARFSGLVAWRGVVPMAALPRHMARIVGTNWVGPGGHVVHYPLRRGELMNVVGIVERGDWRTESWSTEGSAAECAADFRGWHEDVRRLFASAPSLYKWALLVREPMAEWSTGRIGLLGDACHPTLPMLAQGAVMAIEDGYVLARCFEHYRDPAAALARYQAARLERTSDIVRGSAANAERFHNRTLADPLGAKAYLDREWSRSAITRRYEWLFTYDVSTAPI
jgi:salicylate hydroxylase